MSDQTENQEVDQTQQAPAQPQLGIADLQNVKTIIEVATKRGAFAAGELSAVGATFDKLSAFLAAVTPAQPTEETPAADDSTAE